MLTELDCDSKYSVAGTFPTLMVGGWEETETYQPAVAQAHAWLGRNAPRFLSLQARHQLVFFHQVDNFKTEIIFETFCKKLVFRSLPPQLARSGGVAACIEIACLGLRSAINEI